MSKQEKQEQACRFTMTFNLPAGKEFKDYPNFLKMLYERLDASYIVGQGEVAPTTGQKHFQFYMEFVRKKTTRAVYQRASAIVGAPVTAVKSNGSGVKNREYVSKVESRSADPGSEFAEFGEMMSQGKRTDIASIFRAVAEGATDLEIANTAPDTFAQYSRQIQLYRGLCAPKRSWPTKLIFLHGPSGHGKTAQAYTLSPERVRFSAGRFIVGYTGTNEVVLFDEFRWQTMDREVWSEMCDRYETSFEIKGGSINWAPKVIIFTSNDDPATWYPDSHTGFQHEAVKRRIAEFGEVRYFGSKVSHTQRTLNFFWTKSSAPAGPAAATSAGNAMPSLDISGSNEAQTGDTDIIDLTMSDDDDKASVSSGATDTSSDSIFTRKRKDDKRQRELSRPSKRWDGVSKGKGPAV